MRKILFWILVGAVTLFGIGSARADTVTTYSSASTWQTAVGGSVTTEDFSTSTLVTGLAGSFGSNALISGGVLNVTGQLASFPTPTVFTFTPGVTGFGGNFDLTPGGDGGGLDLLITFSNATTTDVFIPGGTPQFNGFLGVVSNGATITSVKLNGASFTGNGESFTLDNLQFTGSGGNTGGSGNNGGGGTTGVPEPGTLVLSALGLAAFALKRACS